MLVSTASTKPAILKIGAFHVSQSEFSVYEMGQAISELFSKSGCDVVITFGNDVPLQILSVIVKEKQVTKPGVVINILTKDRKPQTPNDLVQTAKTVVEEKKSGSVQVKPEVPLEGKNVLVLQTSAHDNTWEGHKKFFLDNTSSAMKSTWGRCWQSYQFMIGDGEREKSAIANSFESVAIYYNAEKVQFSTKCIEREEGFADIPNCVFLTRDASQFRLCFQKSGHSFLVEPLSLTPNPFGCDVSGTLAAEEKRVNEMKQYCQSIQGNKLPLFCLVNCVEYSDEFQRYMKSLATVQKKPHCLLSKWVSDMTKDHLPDKSIFREDLNAGSKEPEFLLVSKSTIYYDRRDFMFFCNARSISAVKWENRTLANPLAEIRDVQDVVKGAIQERAFPSLSSYTCKKVWKDQDLKKAISFQNPLVWHYLLE